MRMMLTFSSSSSLSSSTRLLLLPSPWLLAAAVFCLWTAPSLPLATSTEIEIPGEEWVSCQYYKEMIRLSNCLCQVTEDESHFRVNCDHVVFTSEFPPMPFRQPIIYFSQKYANYHTIPPQAMLGSGLPLQELDLSHSKIRLLTEKSLDGISETLAVLHLHHNLLGDQLNPIFSTNEFKRLPRLKTLSLGHNLLVDIDGGILEGALSLQELNLDNNELRRVPTMSLKGPNALKVLDLSFNRIMDLNSDDFSTQRSLLLLNVSHNVISTTQGNAFRGMSNLKMIDLSWNRLQRLNSDSFQGLTAIEALDLSYNYLTEIPVTALRSLSSTLRGLRLSGNLIQNLKEAMTNGNGGGWGVGIEMLDLSRNRISEIPQGFFSSMPRLREINLGVNQLRTIPAGVFAGLPNLQKLNLMDNNLLTFPSAALDPLTSLTALTLDYNRISALVPMQMHNLTRLSLSNNLIREIPTNTFSNFPQLSHLNLYGNLIENLDEVSLPVTIQHLSLGLNSLKSVPRFQLPNLESLNLEKNSLSTLLQHNFVLLGELKVLDLSSNAISTFFPNTFDGLDALEILNMASNNIEVLPKFGNLEMLRELNFSKNRVKEVGGMENMENLRVLDLSSNLIANLPTDLFSNTTNLESIILEKNQLTSFKGFEGMFERLKELNLANNQISYVYPNSFSNFEELWLLNFRKNSFTFFPTEFLKHCKQLRGIDLSSNQIKSLNEMNFSNFPHLRQLTMTENFLESIPHNSFLNSSQLQFLDLSSNKLESLDGNMFHGLYRLELDLSNNYLASLPPAIFDRMHVQRLQKIRLNKNTFSSIPSEALQRQYAHLEHLDLGDNQIREIPQNLNILVNVKTLDLGKNPLTEDSLKNILNEPKTVRHLSLAETGLKEIPILEMPFLRSLNLSRNLLKGFSDAIFKRTTLLKSLTLDGNQFVTLTSNFPPSLTLLDMSSNPLKSVNGLPERVEVLRLNHLTDVMKIEKTSLYLKNLVTLEMYDLPKLGYLDIRGILTNLQYLENFDFEVKDTQIVDQIHPGINAKVKNIGLRGRQIRSISTGAFAGLTSPSVRISLINTSLTLLPSILVPVPMSTNVILDLEGSKITNLSPPFLSQNIRLEGLNPKCDCNSVHLVKYLKNVESSAMCAGPKTISVMDIGMDQLICDPIPIPTTPPPRRPSTNNPTSPLTETPEDDIIWSIAPKTYNKNTKYSRKQDKILDSSSSSSTTSAKRPKAQDINNMDNVIIAIVGGVVGLIVLFIFIIVCFVKVTSRSSSQIQDEYPPPAPSVISGGGTKSKCTCPHSHNGVGVGGGGGKGGGQPVYIPTHYSTVRSGAPGGGGGGKMSQQPQGYPSLPSFGGAVYASYLAGHPMPPQSMGPTSLYNFSRFDNNSSNNNNNNNSNTYGPSSLRNQQLLLQQQQQQQQQQQMYTSLPYFVQDEYERR